MSKKVAIIGTAGIPASYGGFETLAEHLTRLLNQQFDFTVYCTKRNDKRIVPFHNNSRLIYLRWGANGKQSVIYDLASMLHAITYADVMLVLGVSGCLFFPLIRLLFRGKIIVNIDGLEWKRDKWRWYAKWFLRLSEAFAVWFSHEVIADHPIIQDYVKETYGKEARYIAYGADHVVKRPLSDELLQQYPFLKQPYALSVCRIEPENNVHMIMDAMTRPGMMNFVIIGNWDGNQYARDLKEQCLRYKNVHMLDPIYDQAILDQFRSNCAVYIHGHSAGGTNPSLIEAMSLQLLTFAFDVNYNKSIIKRSSQFFSSPGDLSQLVKAFNVANQEESTNRAIAFLSECYFWKNISTSYQLILDVSS